MALESYLDIRGAIVDWTARDDLGTRLDDFIALAESAMRRRLDSLDAQLSSTIVADGTSQKYSVPAGLLKVLTIYTTLSSGKTYTLEYRSPEQFFVEQPVRADFSYIYTRVGNEFLFGPIPPQDQEYVIVFQAKFTPLSVSSPTNWILENYPDAYLTGALTEAWGFIKDKEEEAKWLARFMGDMELIETHIEDQKYGSVLEIQSV